MKRPGQKIRHFPAFFFLLAAAAVCCYATSRNNRMAVEPPKKPFNISCVTNATNFPLSTYTICYWDEAGNSQNTTYTVTMEQYIENHSGHCTTQLGQKYCQLSRSPTTSKANVTITVTAQNSAGNASATVLLHSWEILKFDPPKDFWVKPNTTSLRVEWDKNKNNLNERCQVQYVEEGTDVRIVSSATTHGERAILIGDIKPCTNYTVAVRCAYYSSRWSDWSVGKSVLSSTNFSSVPFYLWGNILDTFANGTRRVQLMWKGPSPLCNAIDEYRLYVDSENFKHLKPTQHYATVLLNTAHNEISIAAYKNNTELRQSSLKIPFTAKDMPPVQRPSATARGGLIRVSWDAPSMPVKYYVIEWFTDPTEAHSPSWNTTQDTNISLPADLPYKLYTVTITALYDDGPGQRSTIHTYAKQGAPAKVKEVKLIEADATWLTVEWQAVQRNQCCGFVVNYTVFYGASAEPVERQLSVTVDHTNHQVTLRDLHPSTTYHLNVRANSIDNSSESDLHTFRTEAYGKAFIKTLVYVVVCLILLVVIAVCILMLRRRVVNLMVPNPQFSSMAMWAPEKSLKPSFSDNRGLDNCHKDRILLCQDDTEMDTKIASAADTASTLSHPTEDMTSVALDISASSRQAESLEGTVFDSIRECQTYSPVDEVEPMQQQSGQASPSPCNPYLGHMQCWPVVSVTDAS